MLFALSFAACEDNDDPMMPVDENDVPDEVAGLDYAEYTGGQTFADVYDPLVASLEANPNISIIAEVDHQSNARGVDSTIRPTSVVYFGNPALGSQLMFFNQRAGIDLPQKMLVYESEDGDIITAYNNVEYISSRHDVGSTSTIPSIKTALNNFASSMGTVDVIEAPAGGTPLNAGLIEVASNNDVDETVENLVKLIEENPNLKLIAEVDHQANAVGNTPSIRPTYLVVFGNPALGTPLIEDQLHIGIDLPQKMLIYKDEAGDVIILYNDIDYVVARHGVDASIEQIATVRGALANIAATIAAR